MKNKIKIYRAINEMTQQNLADSVGIARANLSNIETGKQMPSGDTMLKIAKALGAPAEEIFLDNVVLPALQIETRGAREVV